MASIVFENKVKAWDNSRLEVRKRISNSRFSEQDGYFSEVEQMAFSRQFKKKELDERIMQLKPFALGIAGIEPNLSGALSTFLSLCETLYGEKEFEAVARKFGLARDLWEIADNEGKRPSDDGGKGKIIEGDAAKWDELANGLWTKIQVYERTVADFVSVLFYVAEIGNVNPSANIRSLMLFANQISAKDAVLAGEIQKFAGIADKYVQNGKIGDFRQCLRKRSTYLRLEAACRQMDSDLRQKEEEARKADERARRQREEEERRRREREEKEREDRRRREAEERARREKEAARQAERKRQRDRNSRTLRRLFWTAVVAAVAFFGWRYYDGWRIELAFNKQIAVGDRYLSEKKYDLAVKEYRKALQIDQDRVSDVNNKETDARNAALAEFNVLADELKAILKADRNRFNEDSNQRLDRMSEIFPEDKLVQKYQKMREKQQKKRRKR